MNRRRDSIEALRQELDRLTLATKNILAAINTLEQEEESASQAHPQPTSQAHPQTTSQAHPHSSGKVPSPTDRDGTVITIGDRVTFLTKGKYKTFSGTVTRFSRGGVRLFAVDINGNEVPRAPRNVCVIQNE